MPTWDTQGTHRYYREADLVFFECHGIFNLGDMTRLLEIVEVIEGEFGYVLSAFDTFDGINMTAEARRLIGDRTRAHDTPNAAAIIGASFGIRTVAMLINNAARLVGKHTPPAQFFATTEEALRWLATQRKQWRVSVETQRKP